jgi:hypothetical protein
MSSIHPLSAGWHATEQPDASFTARAAPMWSGWAWVRMSREISSGLRPAPLRWSKMILSEEATPLSMRVISSPHMR